MNHATHASSLISHITRTSCRARAAAQDTRVPAAEIEDLTSSISEMVQFARVAGLPDESITAALRGHRASALYALDLRAYRVATVEDSHGSRHYEVRSDADERVVGFYDADLARDAARVLNTGLCRESLLPAGDPLR
ncbi:hypothetical protein V1Y59_06935 [Gordonia sp. PKS22-38]|uniref:Uncharacterized protein n=1 Tax=Gordonia prachuapensis TaxID=3115651 RepID=A0ABU7MR57_9ACTN|nr:hypothetical protein [Gordonia sp. PKS22-38]